MVYTFINHHPTTFTHPYPHPHPHPHTLSDKKGISQVLNTNN